MDLGAYMNIEELGKIAKDNGIEIPRIRGYRLMENEEPVSKEEIKEIQNESAILVAKRLCEAVPFWRANPEYHEYSSWTNILEDYYLIKDKDGKYTKCTGIRWDRIHGWKRKVLKFEIKKQKKKIQKQYDVWNKYAGVENVLYIHSRMGGWNWKEYDKKNDILNQPWFLDRVDDYFDSTYCDFYAKIKGE